MKNIFENAYFGKVHKTRDGNKALYLSQKTYGKGDEDNPFFTIVYLAIEKYVQFVNHEAETWHEIITCDTEGHTNRFDPESVNANDIVGEWETTNDKSYLLGMIDAFCCNRLYPKGMDLKIAFEQAGVSPEELKEIDEIISKHDEIIEDINDFLAEQG